MIQGKGLSYQAVACHLLGLGKAHDAEDCGSHIGKLAGFNGGILALGHIDAGHGIE